ncbi:hypothetical protein HMPREF1427_00119 [Helicobacter pylori GAM83Bi]|nr:hypothetical protein HMPREF1427_00119 [Helicobacter pylori GAM83Bi]EMH40557.1 hypothetical protein HMPREF1428_00298 [Helicobacter pylori GAM83T]
MFLLDKHRQTPKGTKKLTFGEFVEECVEFYFAHKIESEGQINDIVIFIELGNQPLRWEVIRSTE